jgi:hypothetical protein
MRERRKILLSLTILMTAAVIALRPKSPPVIAAPLGRGDYGSLGFSFAVTNQSARTLEVMVARTDASSDTVVRGFTYRIHTTLQPMATWYPSLHAPPEGVSRSVDVLYRRHLGKLERSLRAAGARLRLCGTDSQWVKVQRIEIPAIISPKQLPSFGF